MLIQVQKQLFNKVYGAENVEWTSKVFEGNAGLRERVFANIEKSRLARESSNYSGFAKFEKEFGDRLVAKISSDAIKREMLKSPSSKVWGTLSAGTNQGVKHFADYWSKYPERIPSLAKRLGVEETMFENTVQGFENFTEMALKVKSECTASRLNVNGKNIYFLEGAEKAKKGIVVIEVDGKIQSMMPSDPKSFKKLQ